jgi:hypothetical protein
MTLGASPLKPNPAHVKGMVCCAHLRLPQSKLGEL